MLCLVSVINSHNKYSRRTALKNLILNLNKKIVNKNKQALGDALEIFKMFKYLSGYVLFACIERISPL